MLWGTQNIFPTCALIAGSFDIELGWGGLFYDSEVMYFVYQWHRFTACGLCSRRNFVFHFAIIYVHLCDCVCLWINGSCSRVFHNLNLSGFIHQQTHQVTSSLTVVMATEKEWITDDRFCVVSISNLWKKINQIMEKNFVPLLSHLDEPLI